MPRRAHACGRETHRDAVRAGATPTFLPPCHLLTTLSRSASASLCSHASFSLCTTPAAQSTPLAPSVPLPSRASQMAHTGWYVPTTMTLAFFPLTPTAVLGGPRPRLAYRVRNLLLPQAVSQTQLARPMCETDGVHAATATGRSTRGRIRSTCASRRRTPCRPSYARGAAAAAARTARAARSKVCGATVRARTRRTATGTGQTIAQSDTRAKLPVTKRMA